MTVTDEFLGRRGKCPKCSHLFTVNAGMVETIQGAALPPGAPKRTADDGIPIEWEIGDTILGMYEIQGLLGEGGMGKVFRVHHHRWGQDLAVKSPKADLLGNVKGIEAFERECEVWVNLGLHSNTVTCFYIRRLGGIPRIFAELVEGGSLMTWIKGSTLYEGTPEETMARIASIGIQVAWGLHHAHEHGVIHRDVKPGNIMMTPDGEAKVTDFGLAGAFQRAERVSGFDSSTQSSILVSAGGMTPAYCSPEQARYERVSKKTDMWSFGLCLLEMCSGGVTWKKGTLAAQALRQLVEQGPKYKPIPPAPRDLLKLIQWCCTNESKNRPKTMLAIVDVLADVYRQVSGTDYPRAAPKSTPGNADSLNNRAVSFLDLGKTEEAEKALTEALRAAPRHPHCTYNQELLNWRSGQITDQQALQAMEEVSIMHPRDLLPLYLSAQIHMERGDSDKAIQLIESILHAAPESEATETALEHARTTLPASRRLVRSMTGHADAVNEIYLSRNGRYVLSGSEDNTLKLWSVEKGVCMRTFTGHSDSIESVALNTDGSYAVSASRDRSWRLWNVSSAASLGVFRGSDATVTAVRISRDSEYAVTGGADGVVRLWNIASKKCERQFEGHKAIINAVGISRDRTRLMSGSRDGAVRIWDAATGACLVTLSGHSGSVRAAWLSPCSRYVVSGSDDGTARLWDTQEGTCLRVFTGHAGWINSVSMSFDSKFVVTGGKDATVRLWDVGNGRCIRTYEGHEGAVRSVDLSRDLLNIVSAGQDRSIKVWAVAMKNVFVAPFAMCQAQRSDTALSAETRFRQHLAQARDAVKREDYLASAQSARAARAEPGFLRNADAMQAWARLYVHLPKGRLTGGWEGLSLAAHKGPVNAIDLTWNGHYGISGGQDGLVRFWDFWRGEMLFEAHEHQDSIQAACLSLDGRLALTASQDSSMRLWSTTNGQCVRVFESQGGAKQSVCFSPDGKFAATGGWDIRLWDVATGRCIRTLTSVGGETFSLNWSRDGRFLLSGGSEEVMQLWDAAQGECIMTYKGHSGAVRSVWLNADGRYALSATSNIWNKPGEVCVWEPATGRCLRTFKGHSGSVNGAGLSDDGRYAVSGSSDKTVRVWDVAQNACIRTFSGHEEKIETLRLCSDGQFIVSGDSAGVLRLWLLDWELRNTQQGTLDENFTSILEAFLHLHTPYAAELPKKTMPPIDVVQKALTHEGAPVWSEDDLTVLRRTLGCAGYGWVPRETVKAHLNALVDKGTQSGGIFSFGWLSGNRGARKR